MAEGNSSEEADLVEGCSSIYDRQSGKGKKRYSYDVQTKLEAIAFAEEHGKEASARKFRVDTKRIREWCQKKSELIDLADARTTAKQRIKGSNEPTRE